MTRPNITPERALEALDAIHLILDGPPDEPGKMWTSSEVDWVASVITRLGYTIREPNEEPLTS